MGQNLSTSQGSASRLRLGLKIVVMLVTSPVDKINSINLQETKVVNMNMLQLKLIYRQYYHSNLIIITHVVNEEVLSPFTLFPRLEIFGAMDLHRRERIV